MEGRQEVELHTVVRADHPLGPAGSWLRRHLVLPPHAEASGARASLGDEG
jgi:hypothetical protein